MVTLRSPWRETRKRVTGLLSERRLVVIKAGGDSQVFEGAGDWSASHGEELVPQPVVPGWRGRRGGGGDVRRLSRRTVSLRSPVEVPLRPGTPGPPIEAPSTARPPHAGTDLLLTLTALLQQTPPLLRTPENVLLVISPGDTSSPSAPEHEYLLVVVGAAPHIPEPLVVVVSGVELLTVVWVLEVSPQVREDLPLSSSHRQARLEHVRTLRR